MILKSANKKLVNKNSVFEADFSENG